MGRSSSAMTELLDGYIPVYSVILLIIQRSTYPPEICLSRKTRQGDLTLVMTRVKIATIRNLGSSPCPRCLIKLNTVHNLGRPQDRLRRVTSARKDNLIRRAAVNTARSLIYDSGFVVDGDRVENILSNQSLVPTEVNDP